MELSLLYTIGKDEIMNDVRMNIANEIDLLTKKAEKENDLHMKTLIRKQIKTLFTALMELNKIQDEIINI
jgi:hypothetical protein